MCPPRLEASIQPIYTGGAAIQPPKGVGFPDPLSGTLNVILQIPPVLIVEAGDIVPVQVGEVGFGRGDRPCRVMGYPSPRLRSPRRGAIGGRQPN